MIRSGIRADYHYTVGVLEVNPVIGHSTPAETLRQTGDSGGVSETGTVFHIGYTERPIHLGKKITLFVIQLSAT